MTAVRRQELNLEALKVKSESGSQVNDIKKRSKLK